MRHDMRLKRMMAREVFPIDLVQRGRHKSFAAFAIWKTLRAKLGHEAQIAREAFAYPIEAA